MEHRVSHVQGESLYMGKMIVQLNANIFPKYNFHMKHIKNGNNIVKFFLIGLGEESRNSILILYY